MKFEDWQLEEQPENDGPRLVATFDNGQRLNLVAGKDSSTEARELRQLLDLLKQHIIAIEPDWRPPEDAGAV